MITRVRSPTGMIRHQRKHGLTLAPASLSGLRLAVGGGILPPEPPPEMISEAPCQTRNKDHDLLPEVRVR
jgi:hypothetical protein